MVEVTSSFLEVCERAARAGGEVLLAWQDRFQAKEKAPRDLVTEADVASQEKIRSIVLQAFPDHQFLGEESSPSEAARGGNSPYRWIVDPLDGTTNYVHGMPGYAVSVALEREGQPLVGVVYDPIAEDCYQAAVGEGAFLNGRRLRVSDCRQLDAALVAVSLPARTPRGSVEVARMVEVLHRAQGIRRLGSAALNLCFVASGRLDGYYTASVQIWDVAAGVLLVSEAGGVITDLDGGPFDLYRPKFVAAATDPLHRELRAAVLSVGG